LDNKLFIRLIITLLLLVNSSSATSIKEFISSRDCNKVLDSKYFKTCYSYSYKGPIAVWYNLDSNTINSLNIEKRPYFYIDKRIPYKYRTTYKDYSGKHYKHYEYKNSKTFIVKDREPISYDRGHLANDADFDFSAEAQLTTYALTNITPQHSLINRKIWLKAEKYERLVTSKLGKSSVINLIHYPKDPIRIGKHKIAVPDKFYKIIYNNRENFKKCFEFNNYIRKIDVNRDNLKDHLIECSRIKKLY
jgi:endonuclease G